MKQIAYSVMLAMLFFAIMGGCSFSGNGYQAEVGIQREQIIQAGETERMRIEAAAAVATAQSRDVAAREVIPWLAAAVCASAAGLVGVTWARRPHRPVPAAPAHIARWAQPYLAADERRYIDCVDGEWVVVDDVRRELLPVARRLVG